MKVKSNRAGIIHLIALCQDFECNWIDEWGPGGRSQKAIRASAKKHAIKTGHPVVVETGTSTRYEAIAS